MARVSHPMMLVWRAVLTYQSPSTYALTLSREDVMVWIMNHDVSIVSSSADM
jgi:hypothetical protein